VVAVPVRLALPPVAALGAVGVVLVVGVVLGPALGEVKVGRVEVVGVVLVLLPAGCSLARICSACSMKLCQMIAGKVPPSTGPPLYRVVIGTSLLG
jgi:hypothetical protein